MVKNLKLQDSIKSQKLIVVLVMDSVFLDNPIFNDVSLP